MQCEFCHRMATTTISNFEGTEEYTVCDFCEEEILREEALQNLAEIQNSEKNEPRYDINNLKKFNHSNHENNAHNKNEKILRNRQKLIQYLTKFSHNDLLKGFI